MDLTNTPYRRKVQTGKIAQNPILGHKYAYFGGESHKKKIFQSRCKNYELMF